jgi:hypothetical protein
MPCSSRPDVTTKYVPSHALPPICINLVLYCPGAPHAPGAGELFSEELAFPSPVAAADSITRDASGGLLYHYAIINMAAVPEACAAA